MDEPGQNTRRNLTMASLAVKVFVVVCSFVVAINSESLSVKIFYLVIAVVFSGLFVFQLQHFRDGSKQ
jgi:hypothetical protein